jgi:hypothetical protein
MEEVYGSDHRPVIFDFEMEILPVRYVNLEKVVNPAMSKKQGVGIINLQFLKLKNIDST